MAPNDKPEKAKTKRDRDQNKSSKSAQAPSSADDLPEEDYLHDDFGFLWTIDALQATYDDRHPKRILPIGVKKGNDIAKVWFPPNVKEMFTRRNGSLYRWRKWGSEIVNSPRPEKKVEVASVFFQAKLDNFVAVFKDCTRYDIQNEDYGWSHLRFHHNAGCVSEVDLAGERDVLAAPAGDSSWMPQVLPEVYNYPIRNPLKSFDGEYGGLCGKLSLLIAMAAFSAVEEHAEDVVAKCFQFGEWKEHTFKTGIGRYQDRGVIVSIYLDPEVNGLTKEHIKALERGSYGAIFANNPPPEETSAYTTQTDGTASAFRGAAQITPRSFNYASVASQAAPSMGIYTTQARYPVTTSYTTSYSPQSMIGPNANIYSGEDDDLEQESRE